MKVLEKRWVKQNDLLLNNQAFTKSKHFHGKAAQVRL